METLWIMFNGVWSADMGVHITALPSVVAGQQRYTEYTVLGRDTPVRCMDGGMDEISLRVSIYIPYEQEGKAPRELSAIRNWLSGSGWLILSNQPGIAYRARILDGVSYDTWVEGFDDKLVTVTFRCDPHPYIYPEVEDIVLTGAGVVENEHYAQSLPRITIEGTGDINITIGEELIELTDIEDGIIIDSEQLECYSLDGTALLNSHASMDDFPVLAVGENAIAWTGDVTRVTISPRWRQI